MNSEANFHSLHGHGYTVRRLNSGDGVRIFNGFAKSESLKLNFLPFEHDPARISEFICEHISVSPDTPGKDFWLVLDHKSDDSVAEGLVRCSTIRSDPGQVKLRLFISDYGRKKEKSQIQRSIHSLVIYFFNVRRKQKIRSFADSDDDWLQLLLEGVGFKKEGCLRENILVKHQWRDEFLYGLLRRDLGLLSDIKDPEI